MPTPIIRMLNELKIELLFDFITQKKLKFFRSATEKSNVILQDLD